MKKGHKMTAKEKTQRKKSMMTNAADKTFSMNYK